MHRQVLALVVLLCLTCAAEDNKRCCPPRVVDLCAADHRRTTLSVAPVRGKDLLTVPVVLDTSPKAPFFIDTSEARTKVAPRYLSNQGYTRHTPKDLKGKEAFSAVTPNVVTIGNQIWTYPRLLVDEQRDFGKTEAGSVAGVLGNDLLSQAEFMLDLHKNELVFFFTRDAIFPRIQGRNVKRMVTPKDVASSLAIPGTINGKPVLVLISTADTSAVANQLASQLTGAEAFDLQIGDLTIRVPSSTVGDPARFARVKADKKPAVILPATLLKDKILYLSPATRSAYLADVAACPIEATREKKR
jgi:hypothetical protein